MKSIDSGLGGRVWQVGRFCGVLLGGAAVLVTSAMAQSVPIAVVREKAAGSFYELDGVIQPVKQSTIASQAAGRIASFSVKAGDKVRAGQVLAVIDDKEVAVGVQKSQAQISQAEAELRNARASLERTRDLQGKGFVSKAALDTAEMQYKGATAVREQAAASALQSSISQSFTRVSAPYDGWVLQTHAEAGDLAVPGKPLVTVFAPLPLRAVVQVPASRAQAVRAASETQVQADSAIEPSRWITPTARSAVPSADPVSQTTEWRLDLSASDSTGLLPGQQVRVRFSQSQASSAIQKLLIPQSAVVRRGELTAVYVVVNGVFSLRAVRLGANLGSDGIEVLAGIASGESIALDPIRAGFAKATPVVPAGK